MVADVLRLRLTLLVNGFRRSAWQTVGFLVAAVYVLVLVGLAVAGTAALGVGEPATARDAVVVGGALLVVGWWLLPLLFFGQDQTLDPQHFVLFGIPARRLATALVVAAFVGVGGTALVLLSAGSSLAWVRSPALVPVALVGGALGALVCVVGSRALTAGLAPVLEGRRVRELTSVAALVVAVVAWFAFVRLTSGDVGLSPQGLRDGAASVAHVAAWTPLGAPWALAGDVADRAWAALLVRLTITGATLALCGWWWSRALAAAMVTPARSVEGSRQEGLGWFGRLPASPTGAVAARTATYWLRDPRYAGSLAIVPLMPVVLVVVSGGDLHAPVLLLAAPLVAVLFGYSVSNDLAYDHTAFALHVAVGVSGRADRWGRCLPALVLSLPVVLVFAVASVALTGRWDLLPAVLGLALGSLGVALGVSGVVSALYLYPVPKPGESPFKQPQGSVTASLVGQSIAMLAVFVLGLPTLVLAVLTLALGNDVLGWATLAVGLAVGGVALVLGMRRGGAIYDRRAPELLQQVLSYR
ncbi:hypothetical protein [Cellulomonas sp. PhB143]|uniref:hypothetical protein n=1 Tax=Cellulomonas sp. PhB143 TaxID=2485186 RepID=UPI000F497ED5|nr:hypothetical protein [Cellulomonas sp. PhB143]ROS76912.1 ABC-2 type transport system permease protein [Cellulomonas sp. PhB143]